MQFQPPESEVLAIQGESMEFNIVHPDNDPAKGPSFFLNNELQPTVSIGGEGRISIGIENQDQEDGVDSAPIEFDNKTSSSVTFTQTGYNTVTAIWSADPGIDLEEVVRQNEDDRLSDCSAHNWQVYVVGEETGIDQLREIIPDIGTGAAIYGGEKLIKWIRSKMETDVDRSDEKSSEEEEEEFFQDKISNY